MAAEFSLETDPGRETIDQVTRELTEWARGVTQGARVSVAPPGSPAAELEVSVYLLDVLPQPAQRGSEQPPRQLALRYLVSASGPEPLAAQRALHQLILSALSQAELQVEDTPLPAALWSALGALPRPAFVLRYLLRLPSTEQEVSPAREARPLPSAAPKPFYGRLVTPPAGPGGRAVALPGARVEVPGTRQAAIAGRNGLFWLESVRPDAQGRVRLRVHAKGQAFEIVVHETGSAGTPATVEVPLPLTRLVGRLLDPAGNPVPNVRVELPDRRQYVHTRADGQFVLEGLPDPFSLDRIAASQAGQPLEVRIAEGVAVLTAREGAPGEPVVIQLVE